jgi:hypothetical protein
MVSVYGAMLLAYPRTFRREYRREMLLVFRDRSFDVAEHGGTRALLPFSLRIVWDWVKAVIRERKDMRAQQINHVSYITLAALSLAAVVLIVIGYTQPPLDDEGTLAHLFQLSIVALLPTGLVFLATADWNQPVRTVKFLVLPTVFVVLAFCGLYYLEHYFYPARYGWHLK